jgi:hypothetical protein
MLNLRSAQTLVLGLAALACLQLFHLIDDLRVDPTATLVSELVKPQAIAGVGGAILAIVLVSSGHRWGRPLAIAEASLVALGFILVHGIPVKSGPLHPYWGQGSADVIQWLGVVLIWACCAFVFATALRLEQREVATSGRSRLTSLS